MVCFLKVKNWSQLQSCSCKSGRKTLCRRIIKDGSSFSGSLEGKSPGCQNFSLHQHPFLGPDPEPRLDPGRKKKEKKSCVYLH